MVQVELVVVQFFFLLLATLPYLELYQLMDRWGC
jgi:hypothetical protein